MYRVDVYLRVRRAVMMDGMSIRETAWTFGLHRDAIRKMLSYSVPAGLSPAESAKEAQVGALHRRYRPILEDDLRRPRKQRHTAKRIFERLRDEYRFDGRYTIVKDYVREHRRQTKEMFVPLSHPPGPPSATSARPWWSSAAWSERPPHCFVLDLPHSDGCFVKAYPAESTGAFLDGHVSAFAYLGGVPQSILYDNTKLAVAKILGDGRRQLSRAFTELQSHYLFEDRFGWPGNGNDKGKWRAWWGTCAETSWCRCRPSRALMRSMHTWSDDAWKGWTPSSGDIRRPSAIGWSGTWTPCCRCRQ